MASLLLATYCILLLTTLSIDSLKIELESTSAISDANCTSNHPKVINSNNQTPALSQSAPYTILDKVVEEQNKTVLRDLLFRLTNGTQLKRQSEQHLNGAEDIGTDQAPVWMLIGPNGTIVGHKLNLNIEKLLENLNNNNFTSEVYVDQEDLTRIVNITISGAPAMSDRSSSSLDEMLLEELILDAMPRSENGTDFMPVFRDNHGHSDRSTSKAKTLRAKPAQSELLPIITPPPIRGAVEVVAENYTIRKVSEEANVFSLRLLHQVNIEKLGSLNLVQAPIAVYQGLGLIMTGALGDTAKELDKVLLGIQSSFENQKLTHDQDRSRLLASFSDILRQLHSSATHHSRNTDLSKGDSSESAASEETNKYGGGTQEQHLIVANNLLFSPSAYEISSEFKQQLSNYFNQTSLTRIEVGSTESIQTINGWIRRATCGQVATIIDKRNTFDETNVMSLLSTSWLQQEWRDNFHKVSSPTRSGIRLKLGQGRAVPFGTNAPADGANLLEFVDDTKQSHFVEYIKSEPTKSIHVYRSALGNGLPVELVTVPFRDSNHRLIAITPLPITTQTMSMNVSLMQQQTYAADANPVLTDNLPDSSALSKLIAFMANNPRKVMRSMWNIIAPDIITKQTLQTIQQARQKNITVDEQLVGANVIPLVQLSIPTIRSSSDSSLTAALNHIGVVNTFDPYQANLIGINGHPFNYYKLHLSNVIFKTTLNLNERGINYDRTIRTLESMRIHPSQKKPPADKISEEGTFKLEFVDDVKLNKPFLYMICDMRTKLILYIGTIRNPTQ